MITNGETHLFNFEISLFSIFQLQVFSVPKTSLIDELFCIELFHFLRFTQDVSDIPHNKWVCCEAKNHWQSIKHRQQITNLSTNMTQLMNDYQRLCYSRLMSWNSRQSVRFAERHQKLSNNFPVTEGNQSVMPLNGRKFSFLMTLL